MIRLKGGLGNQMFQYATARALAEKHNTFVKMDLTLLKDRSPSPNAVYRDYELNCFHFPQVIATADEIKKFNPEPATIAERVLVRLGKMISPLRVYIESSHEFNEKVLSLPDDYCLVGAFQSEKYFKQIRSILLEEFQLKAGLSSKAADMGNQVRAKNAVCLHVRRGDYVSNPLYSKLLGTRSVSYYEEGLKIITEKETDLHLFVFSDDILWCMENMSFKHPVTFISADNAGDNPHEHLVLMSLCRHFVIANSSFSWWAAWLSRHPSKIVVAPKIWFADGSMNDKDIVPLDWIKL